MSKFQANLKKQTDRAFMIVLELTDKLVPAVILKFGNSPGVTFPFFADARGGIEACSEYMHSSVTVSIHKPATLVR